MTLLQTLPNFFLYLSSALALFCLFIGLYIRLTPYHELELIRQGNAAAACALLGTALGFVLPLASSIAHSASLRDMLVWGGIAMLVLSGTDYELDQCKAQRSGRRKPREARWWHGEF